MKPKVLLKVDDAGRWRDGQGKFTPKFPKSDGNGNSEKATPAPAKVDK